MSWGYFESVDPSNNKIYFHGAAEEYGIPEIIAWLKLMDNNKFLATNKKKMIEEDLFTMSTFELQVTAFDVRCI